MKTFKVILTCLMFISITNFAQAGSVCGEGSEDYPECIKIHNQTNLPIQMEVTDQNCTDDTYERFAGVIINAKSPYWNDFAYNDSCSNEVNYGYMNIAYYDVSDPKNPKLFGWGNFKYGQGSYFDQLTQAGTNDPKYTAYVNTDYLEEPNIAQVYFQLESACGGSESEYYPQCITMHNQTNVPIQMQVTDQNCNFNTYTKFSGVTINAESTFWQNFAADRSCISLTEGLDFGYMNITYSDVSDPQHPKQIGTASYLIDHGLNPSTKFDSITPGYKISATEEANKITSVNITKD